MYQDPDETIEEEDTKSGAASAVTECVTKVQTDSNRVICLVLFNGRQYDSLSLSLTFLIG